MNKQAPKDSPQEIHPYELSDQVGNKNEQRYHYLFEYAPLGIFQSSSDGKLLDANPALAKLLGFNDVNELCTTITNLSKDIYAHPPKREELIERLKSSSFIENFEFQAYKKDGSLIWISLNARLSKYVNHEDFIIEGFITDVTEKKNAELRIFKQNEELIELNATKDKFFSIIAHDLRNPFNGLQALSMLLLRNYLEYDAKQVMEILELIQQSAERGVSLLENLLEWSRVQTGRIEYTPEVFSLSELVDESISLLLNQSDKKQIKLETTVSKDIQVFADRNMTFTVLRNLISNAIKFTFKEGNVTIGAEPQQNFIRVSVADNGTGILPDFQERLFKLGKNFSTKGTANESGTGLGLILCKDFVDKQGGDIWVESVYEKGSTFIFTIPIPDKL